VIDIAYIKNSSEEYIGISTIEGKIKILKTKKEENEWKLIEEINFENKMIEALDFFEISQKIILVLGGIDYKVHLYTLNDKIQKLCSLEGHQDWIKCFSIKTIEKDKIYYLASGSQDTKIRIWK
jgi:WD40 repeat protein